MKEILGIDVGATGIKGGIVDISSGELLGERIKYPTPKPATTDKVLEVMGKIIDDHQWRGKSIGVGFPAIIKNGTCQSASNIDNSWIGFNLLQKMEELFSADVALVNDADAAGMAEMAYGQIDYKKGIVILLTLGTGIGSAVFHDGKLLPNTELGHLKFKDAVTEKYASNNARESKGLSWKDWGKELDAVIRHIDFIFSPDLFILGGGISKKFNKYEKYLKLTEKIIPARLLNNAGIVGAALAVRIKNEEDVKPSDI